MSSVLLAIGVTFVFAGMSAALGFTVTGALVSVAAIGTLLYAGGTWFAGAPLRRDAVLVFDRALVVACGSAAGTPVAAQFPAGLRREIEERCAAVWRGEAAHFTCEAGGIAHAFHTAPVRAADGTIVYGVLLNGVPAPAPAALV